MRSFILRSGPRIHLCGSCYSESFTVDATTKALLQMPSRRCFSYSKRLLCDWRYLPCSERLLCVWRSFSCSIEVECVRCSSNSCLAKNGRRRSRAGLTCVQTFENRSVHGAPDFIKHSMCSKHEEGPMSARISYLDSKYTLFFFTNLFVKEESHLIQVLWREMVRTNLWQGVIVRL